MIDYEKLKICHQLAQTLSNKTECSVHIEVVFHELSAPEFVLIDASSNPDGEAYRDIDVLIKELHFLTQDKPKPKYKVGQTVAYIDEDNIPQEFMIEGMCDFSSISYWESKEDDLWYDESELFPTKQALIEHQIQYWQQKLIEEYCPPFEGPIERLSSCCSVHTGTTEECVDIQRNQDEVDLDGCQHESEGEVWIQQYADMSLITEYFKCKYCGEFYR